MSLQAPGLPKPLGSPGQACRVARALPSPRCPRSLQAAAPGARRAVLGCQGAGTGTRVAPLWRWNGSASPSGCQGLGDPPRKAHQPLGP